MNKLELAAKISERVGLTRKQLEQILGHFTEIVTEQLKKGNDVTLSGFGNFHTKIRKERKGVNPQKPGERIQIPAATVAKFKPGKNLKAALRT